MPIETICQGCGKRLRVADVHAGKLAKCPDCQQVYTVPHPATAAALGAGLASNSSLPPDDRWHLRTDGGLTFGPVSRRELDRWQAEGRVGHGSQILHEGQGQWVWAGAIYPHLAPLSVAGPHTPLAPGASFMHAQPGNPYAPPGTFNDHFPLATFAQPHRGPLVLALGLIGFFACPIVSIVAIILGFSDLSSMKRGVMDPTGRALTIAGIVLGFVSMIQGGLTVLIFIAMILGS